MSYAVLISGKINATDTKQVIVASHNSETYVWSRVTNGGRGTDNAWSIDPYLYDVLASGGREYPIIGEVLSSPLTQVDTDSISAGVIPNVLIQKLTKQYRLRHDNVDTTRTMREVLIEVGSLIAQDPTLLAKYRSDGRSDKSATTNQTQTEGKIIMTAPTKYVPLVIAREEREESESHTLSFVPSLTSESVRTYVPRTFNGLTEEQIYDLAITKKINVSIEGSAGTGKTTSVMTYASKKGLEFGSVSCNAGIEPSQFFGRLTPNLESKLDWSDGLFTHFFRYGGCLVIDEADHLPQKLASVLHGALDDRRLLTLLDHKGEIIKAHPDLLIVMCWNGRGYAGTSRMNEAFADRFGIKLQFDYDSEIEKKFIPSKTLLELATSMRADSLTGIYETPVSTRLLKNFVQLTQELSYDFAVDNFINNFRQDERPSVRLLLDSQRYNLELELTGKVSE